MHQPGTPVDTGTDTGTGTVEPARRLSRSDRYQPLLLISAIGVGLGLARITPGIAASLLPLVTVGVGFLIYLIMLGLDLGRLRWRQHERRLVVTAVVLNFAVVPVFAWALGAVMLSGHPELRVGLLLFLVTPCIGWYLVFIDLAGGDTALGIGLLGINLVLQVVLLPVYVQLFAGTTVDTDLGTVIGSVITYLVVPAALAIATRTGLALRRRSAVPRAQQTRPSTTRRLAARVPSIATSKTITLMVVITSMFASQSEAITDDPATLLRVVSPVVAFFTITFLMALIVARALRLPFDQTVVLVFTTTSRNSEASLAIAVTAFASPLVAAVVAIGPAIELPLLVLMVRALRSIESQ